MSHSPGFLLTAFLECVQAACLQWDPRLVWQKGLEQRKAVTQLKPLNLFKVHPISRPIAGDDVLEAQEHLHLG